MGETVSPRSGAAPVAATPDLEARLGAPDDASRYEVGGLLGRGGMGEVRVARDPRLGRDVALKTARPEHPDGARRLLREAATTARLEHPNIVPVYAAGRDPDGTPYYTMRVLQGQSLAHAIAAAPDAAARLRLVRHVLVAAEAIAYAHGRGVLHRDVKPANILVGVFGETVVTDWGLACAVDAPDDEAGSGTSGFAAPEQIRGDRVDVRADVYGLGATLYAILAGGAPPERPPPVRSAAPEAPVELAAIADRALAFDREARYPGARALADDLLAWFEGRRVAAHAYSTRELASRLWARWRGRALVGLVGVVALATAVAVGWWRTEAQRARAQAAAAEAIAARGAEESALASALLAQALSAAREGRALDAEVLAANALVRRELPTARGVLAQFGERARLSLVGRRELPPCRVRAANGDGALLLCLRPGAAEVFSPDDPARVVARVEGEWQDGHFAGDDLHFVLIAQGGELFAWTPPAAPAPLGVKVRTAHFGESLVPGTLSLVSHASSVHVDVAAKTAVRWHGCGEGEGADQGSTIAADGAVYTTCADRTVRRGPPGVPGAVFARLAERDDPANIDAAAGVVVVSTVRGGLLLFDATGREVERFDGGDEGAHVVALRDDRIAAAFDDGRVWVWARGSGALIGVLRQPLSDLRWADAEGAVLRLVGDVVEDRAVALPRQPHLIDVGAGVSGLALTPDGTRVAVALGDGTVREHALADGRATGAWHWQESVAKDVSYDPTGAMLATAITQAIPQRILPRPDGPPLLDALPAVGLRRVTWLASGWAIACSYVPFVWGWKPGMAAAEKLAAVQLRELERDPAGKGAVAVDNDGALWRITDGSPPTFTRVTALPAVKSVALLGDGILAVSQADVLRLDANGVELARYPLGAPGQGLAVSPDGRLFAASVVSGDILVWRPSDPAPLARLVGHTARVTELSFTPDGKWLVSGGWDDSVRVWSMAALETPAEALRTTIERDWGRDLSAVLE